jgi:hypothetical protein
LPERLFVAEEPIPPAEKCFASRYDYIVAVEMQFTGYPGCSQHPNELPAASAWVSEHEHCAESLVQIFDPKQKEPDQFLIRVLTPRHV